MRFLDVTAAVLLVIGGLNWGLWAVAELDVVATLFGGSTTLLAKLVYSLVGVAAIYQVFSLKAIQRRWYCAPSAA